MHSTVAKIGGLALVASMAVAVPASAGAESRDDRGPVSVSETRMSAKQAADLISQRVSSPDTLADPIAMPESYPYQPRLRTFPQVTDASEAAEVLVSYSDIARKLNRWMGTSKRISTQIVGQSTEGRDLYLVTVTAPETAAQTAQQTAWRDQIRNDPAAAAANAELAAGYKTPIWFSANIHGNEWEGADAELAYIKELVDAKGKEVRELLANNRLYFSITLNPDGRVKGTRSTRLLLDANRDMVTNATPESQSYVRTTQALQAVYSADLHGYTDVLQVEPTGPPHGSNYEYDLFIPHNYAIARRIERDVVAAEIPGNTYLDIETGEVGTENTGNIRIPYRDIPSGWDDFPPIFTAQYGAFYGSLTSTVELPHSRAEDGTQTRENAVINKAVALQTVKSIVGYVSNKSAPMLKNQIEVFRRGVEGAPKVSLTKKNIADVKGPSEWKELWDKADNQEPVRLPRAYVIPVGESQRSMSDARALVQHLLFHDIEVRTLDAATDIGGTTYPKGSYVVDMHQPLRGLANSLLDLGDDISAKLPTMYDISAWSWSYLWGATVAKVGSTTDPAIAGTTRITAPTAIADAPTQGPLTFDLAGVEDYRALNALLDAGAQVSQLADGTPVLADADTAKAPEVAKKFDIDFDTASADQVKALTEASTKRLSDMRIGYTGWRVNADVLSLLNLGFDDLKLIRAGGIYRDASRLDDIDVLWVGGEFGLNPKNNKRVTRRLRAFVADGGSIVGYGAEAALVARKAGLLRSKPLLADGNSNGIVAVQTPTDSVLAPHAQATGFAYPPMGFEGLGAGVKVEQSYAADPMLAGHWRRTKDGVGPAGFAGQPAAVSASKSTGARAFLFGTTPTFRVHPAGGMSQVGQALLWAHQGAAQ